MKIQEGTNDESVDANTIEGLKPTDYTNEKTLEDHRPETLKT
jgi:hypothetical protein